MMKRPASPPFLPAVLPVVLAMAWLATLACAAAPAGPVAYVAVAGDNHVRIVDLESGETLRRIYSGATPWRLAVSPDDGRLWVQHWYAGTTAVVDPAADHAVVATLPFRGPGTFLGDGDWLTAHWPGRTLARVDPRELTVRGEHDSEIKEIYDLAPFPGDPTRLLLAQHDPMARGGRAPRYGYVLTYRLPEDPATAASAIPLSHPVGRDPLRVVPVPGQPFFLTADSGTNGIHVVNDLGDRRALAVCPAPREIAISKDGRRTAVVCWRGAGHPSSRVVMLESDFTARPWPELRPVAEATLTAGLVAAELDGAAGRLWVVDRPGGRLLGLDAGDLSVRREVAVGDLPADLVLVRMDAGERGRAARPPESRRPLLASLEGLGERGGPFRDLAWVETLSWQEAVKSEEEEADPAGSGADDGDAPETVERSRRLRVALRPPDALRTETGDGAVRLAAGGDAVSLDAAGRFWTTPRQDLLGVVLALQAVAPEEGLRRLAGDVAGGPALGNGIAVDRVTEVEEGGRRYLVVGADPGGERVSQLWIDLENGLPVQLVERFPVFAPAGAAAGHGGSTPPAVAETALEDWEPVAGAAADAASGTGRAPLLPRRLRRVLEGSWVQHARLDDVVLDRGLPEATFDPRRLAGVAPSPELFRADARAPRHDATAAAREEAGPGRAPRGRSAAMGQPATELPVDPASRPVGGPFAPHPPYASNPPTSGAHLDWAAEAGVHSVPVPLGLQVHHLLDGGVALQYDCPGGCPELRSSLAEVAARHDGVLVAPYPWLGAAEGDGPRIALTAWGRRQLLDGGDFAPEVADRFVEAWGGVDHHGELEAPSLHTETR